MEPEKFVGNKSGSVDANDSFWTEEEMSAVDNELAEAAGHHELGGDSTTTTRKEEEEEAKWNEKTYCF